MQRADFGHWGTRLDADTFAKALAAAGVLVASGEWPARAPVDTALEQAISAVPPGGSLAWRVPPRPVRGDAGMLASIWDEIRNEAGKPLRLTIEGLEPGDSPMWLAEALGREAVGLASVVVAPWTPPNPIAREAWHWPVDLGFLSGERSDALRDGIERDLSVEEITELREVGPDNELCDLLVLPYDLRVAVAHALTTPVRASCVAVLGAAQEPWERMRPMLETLVAHARASAVVVAAVPEAQRTEWVGALMHELAQDAGLDVALQRATPGTPPLIVAPERMLRRTRMGAVVEDLREMAGAAPPEVRADIQDAISEAIVEPDIPRPIFRKLIPAFGGPGAFGLPPRQSSRVADASRRVAAVPLERTPRFVHADINAPGTGARAETLLPGATYTLAIDIGPRDPSRMLVAEMLIETGLFPKGKAYESLRIFLTDLSGRQEPLSKEVILPREGRSTMAAFPLEAGDAGERLEYRILVMHGGRVLQTLKLRATVGQPGSVSLDEEIIARAHLDDLDGREEFDLALVVNETDAGDHGLTAIAGDRAMVMWDASFETHIRGLRDRLDWITDAVGNDTGLGSETMRAFLVSLARDGGPIHDTLRDLMAEAWGSVASLDRIQVVSASIDGYLPLELIYDLPVPNKDAVVCPNAATALATGACAECRDRARAEQQGFVCPLGFWALAKVIERQAFDPDDARAIRAEGGDFELLAEPREGRRSIGALNRIVYAASSRANDVVDGTIEATATALQRWSADAFRQATDWATWTAAIEEIRPDLLVMLPHTEVDDVGEPVIEVGEKQVLHVVEIDAHHVATTTDVTPMVLLLGCATGVSDYPLLKLPTSFRRRGASIVLTTLTTVLGRHAGPVAQMLVEALHSLPAGDTRPFGEIARDVRRKALADGNLMALVLAAYGDADWHLGA